MTVTNTNLRNDYTGNGATTVYAFTFVAIYEVGSAKYSLKVITTDTDGVETLKTQGTDYTVTLASNGTGTITFATAPTSGHKISILPDMTLTQETDYIKSGSDKFPAESHEKALDKLTLIAKQFSELFKRTIKLPSNSLLSEITIPVQTSNANKAIVVNSSGNGLDAQSLIDIGTYPITAFAETLLDDTNASEARQTLGVVIGTNVQAYNVNLQALAGLVGAANKIPYFTGAGAMGLGDLLQIATQAEVNAGTDDLKAITPLKLSTLLAGKLFTSSQQSITLGGGLTLAHGLGAVPDLVIWQMVCITAEFGYSVSDVVFANPMMGQTTSTISYGVSIVPDATNLSIRMSSSSPRIINKTNGAAADITLANWRYVFKAYKF